MSQFILMLTRNDVTIPDALELVEEVTSSGVTHVGFKDVGLSTAAMVELVRALKAHGAKVHLEVVSLSEQDELASAQTASELGVDYLIGGTRWAAVSGLISGSGIRYFPYPGTVFGHPGQLDGSAAQIISETSAMADRVDGINLLAYRHVHLNGADLLSQVASATDLPVICAGSIASLSRVRDVVAAGAWGFTIGAAAVDRVIVPGAPLTEQLRAVLDAAHV